MSFFYGETSKVFNVYLWNMILQNDDVPVSDTDTPQILSDTYPRDIGINYFNLKYILYRILIRYFTETYPGGKKMKCKKNETVLWKFNGDVYDSI